MNLKNKVVVVTGSSSGIGEAIAFLFAKEGAKVVVNSRKNIKGGQEVVKKIKNDGGEASYLQADVSDPEQVKKLFKEVIKKYNTVDVLVNNAGDSQPGDIGGMKVWDYQMKNIFMSSVYATDEFLKIKSGKEVRKNDVFAIFCSESCHE